MSGRQQGQKMSDDYVSAIEARSTIRKESSETLREYVSRVGDERDVATEVVRRAQSYLNESLFAQAPPEDAAAFDEFLRAIDDETEPIDEDGASASRTERAEGAEIVGNDETDEAEPRSATTERSHPSADGQSVAVSGLGAEHARRDESRVSSRPVRDAVVSLDWRDALALTVFVVTGAYVYFVGLGTTTLLTWDEGTYALVARDMVQGGSWLSPHLYWLVSGQADKIPYLEKPLGGIWLEAISMSVFGVNAWGARIPSATFALLLSVLVYFIGRRERSRLAGATAAVICLTIPELYAEFNAGRMGSLETEFVFFGTLFVYATYRVFVTSSRRYLGALVVGAVGVVLVKGFAAGVFVLVVLPLIALNPSRLVDRQFLAAVACTVLLVAPWAIYQYLRFGEQFVQVIFVRQVLSRASGSLHNSVNTLLPGMKYPYLRYVPLLTDPCYYFVAAGSASVVTAVADRAPRFDFRYLCAWWAVSVFGFFCFTGDHAWYVMSAYVPAAFLVGDAVSRCRSDSWLPQAGLTTSFLLALLLTPRLTLGPWSFEGFEKLQGTPPSGWLPIVVLGVVTLGALFPDRIRAGLRDVLGSVRAYEVGSRVAVAVAALVLVGTIAAPVAIGNPNGYQHEQAQFGRTVQEKLPQGATIYTTRETTTHNAMHAFDFYAGGDKRYQRVTVDRLDSGAKIHYALLRRPQAQQLSRDYRVVASMTGTPKGSFVVVEFRS